MTETIPEVGHITVTRFGIVIDGNPDYETWRDAFESELSARNRNAWTTGDLLAYGEAKYGDIAQQAVDEGAVVIGTLYNNVSLCRTFPPSERRWDLTASHYSAVAKLVKVNRPLAYKILQHANETRCSRDIVREMARKALNKPDPPKKVKVSVRPQWDADNHEWWVCIPNDSGMPLEWNGQLVDASLKLAEAA